MSKQPGPRHGVPIKFSAIHFPGGTWISMFFDPGYGYDSIPFTTMKFTTMTNEPIYEVDINDRDVFDEFYNDIPITKEMLQRKVIFKSTDPVTGEQKELKVNAFGFANVGDPHYPRFELQDGSTLGAGGIGSSAFFFKSPTTSKYKVEIEQTSKKGWNGAYFGVIAATVFNKGKVAAGKKYPNDLAALPYDRGTYYEIKTKRHIFEIDPAPPVTITDIFV